MTPDQCRAVVIGAMNVDFSVIGVPRLPTHDEDVFGPTARVSPGGKSRNVAEMMARLLRRDEVAFVSRTTRDRFGLWQVPFDGLRAAGVNTDLVVTQFDPEGLPDIALVTVDTSGQRNASVGTGCIGKLSKADIDHALSLFERCAANRGVLVLSLEVPLETAAYAAQQAAGLGLRIALDPGGSDLDRLESESGRVLGAARGTFVIKPNQWEAARLTGVEIVGFASARRCARVLMDCGIQNVLITHGSKGAYFFSETAQEHIVVPRARADGQMDATGCGDQAMAVLCARLVQGRSLVAAARTAVVAATLQYHRIGVQPVSAEDIVAAEDRW